MKRLFMNFAAMLLVSVSAFAQSGNNEPLKGDVNGDGTVDVADIVDVIKILKDAGGAVGEKMCYWYAGTEQVEADNFTDVASRIPESEIPETGSVTANGQYVYFVMPETKHLESLTYANGSVVEFTCTDVMGYLIYKTNEIVNTTINYTIKQTIYYWYAGQTPPESISGTPTVDDENFTNNKWHTLNANQINQTVQDENAVDSGYWYWAVPTILNMTPRASDMSTLDTSVTRQGTITVNSVSYTIWKSANPGWKKNIYMK